MTRTILTLILIAVPLAAADSPREIFPSDYESHPCAPAEVCGGVSRMQVMRVGTTFRGFSIDPRWIRANWNDLQAALQPLCDKVATCFATAANGEVFCIDLVKEEFLNTANRFPRDSEDWDQWTMTALSYYLAHFGEYAAAYKQARRCVASQPPDGRTGSLELWVEPATFGPDYDNRLAFYAIDAKTRVPVMARITLEGQTLDRVDTPDGLPSTAARLKWPVTFNRTPNASGHEDLVVPVVTASVEGYETVTFKLPLEVPEAVVNMTPSPSSLKPGKNTITITAHDAATGAPVELRVMAGDLALGDSNQPLVLEIPKSGKRPEIWVTSLFDRYSDMVVAAAD